MKGLLLTNEDVAGICSALSHLFHAGISAGDAFTLLCDGEENVLQRDILMSMAAKADDGIPISRIFSDSGVFPNYVCTLLEVGESVGKTEETLSALSRYYDSRARMSRQLTASLLYPAMLLTALLAVVFMLLVWVLPIFDDVYAQLGSHLSGFAGALLSFGRILRSALPVFLVLLTLIVLLLLALRFSLGFRSWLLELIKKSSGDRGIIRSINTARFLQALSMAMSSGMSAQQSVSMAAPLVGSSAAFRQRCHSCLKKIETGDSLPHALRDSGLLSATDARLLDAGLRSGQSELVMAQIAQRRMEDSEAALERMASRIEPILIVIACLMVGAVLLSVMLPLMRIMTAIG